MSHQATTWVLERSEQEGREFIVLFVIANHCHPDGTGAFPSMETIAGQARISERGARYAVEALEVSGELYVERTFDKLGHKRNYYTIPGVIADGFYRSREPKPAAPVAGGDENANGKPTGKPNGNELPINNPKELNTEQPLERVDEAPKIQLLRKCSKCGFEALSLSGHECVRPKRGYPRPTANVRTYEQAPRESATERRSREASEQVARLAATVQARRDRRVGG